MADPVSMRFHRSLYPVVSVRRAAERFARFGPEISEHEADVSVVFTEVPDALRARLAGEFGNHALFQAVVDAREAG